MAWICGASPSVAVRRLKSVTDQSCRARPMQGASDRDPCRILRRAPAAMGRDAGDCSITRGTAEFSAGGLGGAAVARGRQIRDDVVQGYAADGAQRLDSDRAGASADELTSPASYRGYPPGHGPFTPGS